ncbi:DUF4193 family protein [Specibacter sp. NPDC057265]|uniref:DUF4193 family protein n=1 Tax=Specibacter sp. NPDC057265 TaxID=3346075 RepID=UPI003638482A
MSTGAGHGPARSRPLQQGTDLPGADLSNKVLIIQLIPAREDEFSCGSCFRVRHRTQVACEKQRAGNMKLRIPVVLAWAQLKAIPRCRPAPDPATGPDSLQLPRQGPPPEGTGRHLPA